MLVKIYELIFTRPLLRLKESFYFGETYLYTIFFNILIQNIFGIPNYCKVGQVIKELEK
jgi:hypothetical protein